MSAPSRIPSVLFICVRNGGKSQMAAALMRLHAGEKVEVHSAGIEPGTRINALAAEVVAEVGADMTGQVPTALDPDLTRRVDRVVVLGAEAAGQMDDDDNARTHDLWITDEPSDRGIYGSERMRLVREDIDRRVRATRGAPRRSLTLPLAPPAVTRRPRLSGHQSGSFVGTTGAARGKSATSQQLSTGIANVHLRRH